MPPHQFRLQPERIAVSHLVDLLGPVSLVAVTGYGEVRDRDRSQQAGFAAHLVKPVDLKQLADALAQLTA